MGGLMATGFLVKAFVSHSKVARPLLVSVPFLIILALPQLETLMATLRVWHTPARGILEKPAFAFFLINCMIVTIIASSKLGSEKRGHGEEKGNIDLVPNIGVGKGCHYSVDTSIRSEAGSPQYEKPATSQHCFDATTADCLSWPPHGAAAPATDHPSLQEVWAAIMASNKTDHHTSCKTQAKPIRGTSEADSRSFSRPQPAAAPCAPAPPPEAVALYPPSAVLLRSSRLPSVLSATPVHPAPRAAKAATNPGSREVCRPHRAATEKHVKESNDNQQNDSELEELNRRAEQFIARFNRQMRLQREDSSQRQKRGPRPCNYDHGFALRVPARGLLVG